MKITIPFLIGFLLISNVGFGHHLIQGVVTNAEDQIPLIGATIQIEGKHVYCRLE